MIRKILPLLLFVWGLNFGATAQEPTNIKVSVKGLEGGTIKLIGMLGKQNYIADSAKADANGNFAFTPAKPFEGGLYYIVLPERKFIQVLIDKDQQFEVETELNRLIQSMKVTGSYDNELFYKNLKYEDVYSKELKRLTAAVENAAEGKAKIKAEKERDKLIAERKAHIQEFSDKHADSFFTAFKIAGQNPEIDKPLDEKGEVDLGLQAYMFRQKWWNGVDFNDERLLHTPVFHNKLEKFIKKLTPQNPDSVNKYVDFLADKALAGNKEIFKYVVNWVGLEYREAPMMGRESVFSHVILKYFTPELAFWSSQEELRKLRKKARDMSVSLMGMTGGDFTTETFDGSKFTLYDLDADIIVIYFYSTSCSNCKKQSPGMVKLYNEWADKGVDFVGFCVDQEKEDWAAYIKKHDMRWHNVWDPTYASRYYKHYFFDHTPGVFVLGKDHKIIAKHMKDFQLPDIFEKELKKKK